MHKTCNLNAEKHMIEKYRIYLEQSGFARNTVNTYVETVRLFLARFGRVNEKSLCEYKVYLIEHYRPKTVNLRINAMNRYLDYLHKGTFKLKGIKDPQKAFLENVISNPDYRYLKRKLRDEGYDEWYFAVWFMGATGARISELLKMKAEHVHAGYVDLYTKGGKIRRIYIPDNLRLEAEQWLEKEGIHSGYLFRNRYGKVISPRGMALRLQGFAEKYGIDPKVVHPHSFRHLFAKNFLEKSNDISFLADLMGHESIETTRIYLRRTATEQREVLDRIVTW